MSTQPVGITDTTYRDAHQSRMATRMTTADMVPVAREMNEIGFWALEMWGGATFDSAMRFIKEDPWERIRILRQNIPDTRFMMLLRGQNILGYHHYPDDVVKEFVHAAVRNGIDTIRIFDALNDVRNMEVAIEATREAGGHVQAAVVYTISPVHDIPHYVETARKLHDLGADSLCIKDMAGIMTPYMGYNLVKELKKELDMPIDVHSHMTSGMAAMTYLKCIEAGADVVDCCLSSLSGGTAQPPTETMVAVLQETDWDTGLNLEKLSEINKHFAAIRDNYQEFLTQPDTEPRALIYQIPGGMLSNLHSQLNGQGLSDKYAEVLEEVPRVRAEMGYPPLVTPMSQIVGTQAVLNVATGTRYGVKSKEIRDYVRGLYGRPPVPISDEIKQKIIGDEEVITCRPAELLDPMMETAGEEISEYIQQPEDVLSYILFPQPALEYFKYRAEHGIEV
ncbi:MAG: pyruvate carboxylase subunit B [Clostridia bacterium]